VEHIIYDPVEVHKEQGPGENGRIHVDPRREEGVQDPYSQRQRPEGEKDAANTITFS